MADANSPRTHVVRQGEHLERLAYELGFDVDTVWGHPENARLRALRRGQHNILCPGDVLYIPALTESRSLALEEGAQNHYSAEVPERIVSLALRDQDRPLPNEPYAIEGLGATIEGKTDGDGNLSFSVPITARHLTLVVMNYGAYPLAVGDLDPITELTGVQTRLLGLGFSWGGPTGEPDADTDDAIRRFQRASGLEMTGKLTGETTAALEKAYGC